VKIVRHENLPMQVRSSATADRSAPVVAVAIAFVVVVAVVVVVG
jgi:hypothetical protein